MKKRKVMEKSPRWRDSPDKESEGLLQWAPRDSLWLRGRWICQRHHSDLTYRPKITELFLCFFSFFLTCHQATSVLNRWVRSGAIKSKIINDCRNFFLMFFKRSWFLFFNERPCGVRGPRFTVRALEGFDKWGSSQIDGKQQKGNKERRWRNKKKKTAIKRWWKFHVMQREKANRQHLFSSEAPSNPVCFVPHSTLEVCNPDIFWLFLGKPSRSEGAAYAIVCAKTNRCRSQILPFPFDFTLRLGGLLGNYIKWES